MVKRLNEYIIQGLFKAKKSVYSINDVDLDETDFFNDLNIGRDIKSAIQSWTWIMDDDDDEDVIDLEFDMSRDYRGYSGNFYVTWEKETLKCTGMWFSGTYNRQDGDGDDDPEQDDHETFSWRNE